jgi:hypothetical protein
MNNWELDIPFDGDVSTKKISCKKCGWSWGLKDGGNDPYVCHLCENDNSKYYLSNFKGAESGEGGKVDVGALVQAGGQIAGAIGSFKSAQALKDANKSEMEKEISLKCGRDRWRLSKKKKRTFDSCKEGIFKKYDDRLKEELASKEKQYSLQEKKIQSDADIEKGKQTTNRNIIIVSSVVVVLGIIGFFVFKKLKK